MGSGPALRAQAPDSLRMLLTAAGPAPLDPGATFGDVEDLLAHGSRPLSDSSLADGETVPDTSPEALLDQLGGLSCGTPVMRAAARALPRAPGERARDLTTLLAGPHLSADRVQAVSGLPLAIHWDASAGSRHAINRRDADRDQVPDALTGLSDDLRTSARKVADLTGWNLRFETGVLPVILAESAFAEGSEGGAQPQMVIPRQLRGPARLEAVAHQLAHAVLRDMAPGMPDTFEEALASYIGETVLEDADGLTLPDGQLLPCHHPDRVLLSPGLAGARGDAAFVRFVSAQAGVPASWLAEVVAVLPRHLEEARSSGRLGSTEAGNSGVAEALDEVLGHHGTSLADTVAEFQAWSLEQDLLIRGLQASVDSEVDVLPSDESRPDQLPPFGQVRLGIQVPAGGGLRLDFDASDRLQAVAIALLEDGSVRRFPLGRGAATRGASLLAAGSLRRLVVLVQSPLIPAEWSARASQIPRDMRDDYTVSVTADPTYPFVLTALGTEVEPGQITLSWDTSGEQDIEGWWVERAVRASGPFVRVSAAPLPAMTWSGEASSYSLVDATVRPSTRYHYRVMAVTSSGLIETTPTTSVRTLPGITP